MDPKHVRRGVGDRGVALVEEFEHPDDGDPHAFGYEPDSGGDSRATVATTGGIQVAPAEAK